MREQQPHPITSNCVCETIGDCPQCRQGLPFGEQIRGTTRENRIRMRSLQPHPDHLRLWAEVIELRRDNGDAQGVLHAYLELERIGGVYWNQEQGEWLWR